MVVLVGSRRSPTVSEEANMTVSAGSAKLVGSFIPCGVAFYESWALLSAQSVVKEVIITNLGQRQKSA